MTRTTKAKAPRETVDVAKGVARMVRALGRRIGTEDAIDLDNLRLVREALVAAEREAVEAMRARGDSWAEIAEGLGTTRQNAQQRFSRKA